MTAPTSKTAQTTRTWLLALSVSLVALATGTLWRNGRAPARNALPPANLHNITDVPLQRGSTLSGLEVLRVQNFAPLKGKRVGLITNPTGVDRDLRAGVDLLFRASGVKLVALYGPEHGVRGDAAAGAAVGNAKDGATGLPVYSLYGATRKPTPAMLKGVEALVFDIQDIGARSYTYISTMGLCMEAAAENGVPFFVLDRPNPCGGERVEGNIPRPEYRSFVGKYPIPYTHGMTVGELAQMINGEGWLEGGRRCDLTVIKLQGWERSMTWAETGLPWVPTSPHIPHPNTSLYYVATGIVGEQPTLNIGVGYTLPFELAGAPGLSARRFAEEMNRRNLRGVYFRPISFSPFYAAYTGKPCGGVQIYFTDPKKAPLARINFELMDAARKLNRNLNFFPPGREAMFDKVCGTNQVRTMFQAGRSAADIWNAWNADAETFRAQREKYLLY